ncbi:MFS transporter [Acidiphilium sp.]|uniref:MFS transporter n=1 Tax=Acidiphilium sp. TaxID=527 RepID=UPI00258A1333|nr:MFS transporter [Acidiphilium sp.]
MTKPISFAPAHHRAVAFIILIGTVSLFADMTYEGARAITGPFLGSLGAPALVVGFVAGFGELMGYMLRIVSGRFADRTGRYWGGMFLGYLVNLFAVPLLALAPGAATAAALMIAERVGRAIRSPLRDAMLSHAATRTGQGWGFGLHEAMDQTGATVGPLLVAFILWRHGGYRTGFALLLIPACVAMALVLSAARAYPHPRDLAPLSKPILETGFPWSFWMYCLAGGLIGAGYVDFALVAYHFGEAQIIAPAWIPVFYAIAMLAAGGAALGLGRMFDRFGIVVVLGASLVAALATPLVFLGGFGAALVGVVLWGIGMGAQDSVLKAALSSFIPPERRATGYGTYDMLRGVAWFLGSLLLGFLYDHSLVAVVVVSLVLQVLAAPVLLAVMRRRG